MAKPVRNANSTEVLSSSRTFFATTKTSMGRPVFQSERNAALLIDVLRSCVAAKRFRMHDFVVMPDHLHVLLTVTGESTIERAMQFIKGGFSYRIKKELGYLGEVWQRGFSELRVEDKESFIRHREYIAQNPVRAGRWTRPRSFLIALRTWKSKRQQGLKPTKDCLNMARL